MAQKSAVPKFKPITVIDAQAELGLFNTPYDNAGASKLHWFNMVAWIDPPPTTYVMTFKGEGSRPAVNCR